MFTAHACMWLCVHVLYVFCVCTHIHIHVYIHIHTFMAIIQQLQRVFHMYIHIHMYTYTRTHTHSRSTSSSSNSSFIHTYIYGSYPTTPKSLLHTHKYTCIHILQQHTLTIYKLILLKILRSAIQQRTNTIAVIKYTHVYIRMNIHSRSTSSSSSNSSEQQFNSALIPIAVIKLLSEAVLNVPSIKNGRISIGISGCPACGLAGAPSA
jgi:hypothetical protein